MKSGTPDGQMVADMIKNGQIVPSRVSGLERGVCLVNCSVSSIARQPWCRRQRQQMESAAAVHLAASRLLAWVPS